MTQAILLLGSDRCKHLEEACHARVAKSYATATAVERRTKDQNDWTRTVDEQPLKPLRTLGALFQNGGFAVKTLTSCTLP